MHVHCADCNHKFLLGPDGVVSGACENCGGTRLERDQPSPTKSDGELRDMVDPGIGLDQGGNPLQEGIWATTDGGWQPWTRRDESFASVQSALDLDEEDMHHLAATPGTHPWPSFGDPQRKPFTQVYRQLKQNDQRGHQLNWTPGMHGRALFVGPYLHSWNAYDPNTVNADSGLGMMHGEYGQQLAQHGVDPQMIDYSTGVEIHPDGTVEGLTSRDTSKHINADPRLKAQQDDGGFFFGKVAEWDMGGFDFSEKNPTHKFIVTSHGTVHSMENPCHHEDIADAHDLHRQGYPKGMSLGELNDDGTADWYQHEAPHSAEALSSMLYGHFGQPVTIDPNLKPTTNEERWGLPPTGTNPNDPAARGLTPERQQQMQQAEQMRGRPYGYYDNPFINRGGSVDRSLNMDPYMPWTHEATVKTADEPVAAPPQAPAGPQHHATVTPGPYGIHAGTVKWLQFLDAHVDGVPARQGGGQIIAKHGTRGAPTFGQPVQVSVHHPEHLEGAINTIETSAQGGTPPPKLKELALGIAAGTHPTPPGVDPTKIRFGSVKQSFLPALAMGALRMAGPALMRGALMGAGSSLVQGVMGQQDAAGELASQPPQPPRPLEALARTADMETPHGNPGYYHDDPEKVDQQEFNDGDSDPNFNNPNNDDSGASGEDNVPGGFGENSPGMDRLMHLLPVLLEHYHSDQSGENDPVVRALHEQLDQEVPGYLDSVGDEHENELQMLLKKLKEPDAIHASFRLANPVGMQAVNQMQNMQMDTLGVTPQMAGPQSTANCPYCGGVVTADGSCPQCGAKSNPMGGAMPGQPQGVGMQSMPPTGSPNAMAFGTVPRSAANHQGPVTDEQKAAVADLLLQSGRHDEIPAMLQEPWNYSDELAQITGNPNVAPNVDPEEEPPPAPVQEQAPPGATMPVPNPADPSAPTPYMGKVATPHNGAPRCPKCGSATTGFVKNEVGQTHADCHACGNVWDLGGDASGARVAAPQEENVMGVPAADQEGQRDVEQEQDSSHTWQTDDGQPLQVGQEYEMHSPGYAIPDIVKIEAVKPDSITVSTIGEYSNDGDQPLSYSHEVTKEEADLEQLSFVPSDGDSNAGDQSLENYQNQNQAPVNTEPQQAVGQPTGLRSHVEAAEEPPEASDDSCPRCTSDHITSSLSSPTTSFHECFKCGHGWETKEEDYSTQGAHVASWILEDSGPGGDDFFAEMERHKAMRAAGHGARSLADIASRDTRYQEIKSRLAENAHEREQRTAGKKFTPREQREFIDEQGVARNADKLELGGTHYESHRFVERKPGQMANGMDAPDEHLFLGF